MAPKEEKPKRKFKIAQKALETVAQEAMEKTANTLEKKGVKAPSPPKAAQPKKEETTVEEAKGAGATVTATTAAPKKRIFKIAAQQVVAPPPKPPSPKIENATFPILYNKSKTGKIQQWQVEVTLQKSGSAIILTQWGYKDGKLATSEKEITEGKNKGRSNETTPYQQAVSEAQSAWEKNLLSSIKK